MRGFVQYLTDFDNTYAFKSRQLIPHTKRPPTDVQKEII